MTSVGRQLEHEGRGLKQAGDVDGGGLYELRRPWESASGPDVVQ